MHAPLFSTLTLFTELVISAIIYFVIFQGYKNNKFYKKLAGFALLYETLFNISYMVTRVPAHAKAARAEPAYVIGLAIIHGTLSLLMFILLIVFFIVAWRKYKKEINFFKDHKFITFTFLFFWTFSIVSGILFYTLEYVF